MTYMNRLANVKNPYQGDRKRVLCVCSAGLLRSPSASVVLSQEPFNFNTRAAGCNLEFALIPVDTVLLTWADEIVCMASTHAIRVNDMLQENNLQRKVITLAIEDIYEYMQRELVELIKERYLELSK